MQVERNRAEVDAYNLKGRALLLLLLLLLSCNTWQKGEYRVNIQKV